MMFETYPFVVLGNVLHDLNREDNMTTQSDIDFMIDRKLLSVFQALRRMERKMEAVGDRGEVGNYEEWRGRVNRLLRQHSAQGYEVPTDLPLRSLFEAGLSPDEALQQLLQQGYIQMAGESRRRRRPRRESRYSRRRLPSSNKYESNLLAHALVLTDRIAANETRKRLGRKSRRA